MRNRHPFLLLLLSPLLLSCSASGSIEGGDAAMLPSVTPGTGGGSGVSAGGSGSSTGTGSATGASSGTAGATPTWTQLYTMYFGNPATGGCGNTQQICHQAATDTGVVMAPPASGFVCGTSAATCYQGLTKATPPMIGSQFTAAPTTAPLYLSLYKGGRSGGTTSDNMPQTLGYTFSPQDLAAVQAWIAAGSPMN